MALEGPDIPEGQRLPHERPAATTPMGVAVQRSGKQRHRRESTHERIVHDELDRCGGQRGSKIDQGTGDGRDRQLGVSRDVSRSQAPRSVDLDPVGVPEGSGGGHDDVQAVSGRVLPRSQAPDAGGAGEPQPRLRPSLQAGGECLNGPGRIVTLPRSVQGEHVGLDLSQPPHPQL